MKKCYFLFLVFNLIGAVLFSQWSKQGTLNGNITDVEVISWDGSSGLIYVSTSGSGIFKSSDGMNWVEANGSGSGTLPDFNVKAIARIPSEDDYLVAACKSGVWITYNQGSTWQDFNNGLFSTNNSPIPMDIAVSYYGGNYYFYLATAGAGVFRKIGFSGSWAQFNNGELGENNDYYCISIGAQGDKALVGTRKVSNVSTSGHLYYLSGTKWYRVQNYSFPQNISIPAISYRFLDYAFVSVGFNSTSSEYEAVWYSTDGINFNKLNNSNMPKNQPFLSLDYKIYGSDIMIVGGTTKRLYKIPKPGSSDPYEYVPFTGMATGVGVGKICDIFFGGPGKGPYRTDICNITGKPNPIRNGIQDYQISDIEVSSQFDISDYGVFAASKIAGLYKNQEIFSSETGDRGYFTRMISNPNNYGVPDVLCVSISPNYREGGAINLHQLDVFAGTLGEGILKSTDGGRSWAYSNGSGSTVLPDGAIITDIKLSPNYETDETIFAAVYGYGVYKSINAGASWNFTGNMTNKNVLSIELDPNYPSVQYIYAGCKYALNGTLPTFFVYTVSGEWTGKTSYFNTINSITAGETNDTPHIYIGTAQDGILLTLNRGNSFLSFNNGLNSANNFVFKVLVPLSYYYNIPTDNRFLISAIRPNNASRDGGFYWYSFSANKWYPFNTNLPTDKRIISLGIDPNFASEGHIFCGHSNQKIYTAKINKDTGPIYNWTPAEGFFTTPKRINGIAVDPNDSNIVLAATDDMGVFISFDKGETFRPWSKNLTYTSGTNTYVVQKTLSIDITDKWNGTSPDLRTAIVGTSGYGIYYNDYQPSNPLTPAYFYSDWVKSAMTPSTTGNINEIRYTAITEDIRASDTVNGDYHSSNIGANWSLTSNSPSVGLTDLSFSSSGLIRGLGSFVWGCSSGKSLSLRSGICTYNGKAWYFDPTPDQWYQCSTTGLDTCEDFRAILKLSSSTILMGSKDIGGASTTWNGMYRSDDNCSSWEVSNEGLPTNPKVYALQQLSNGDIVAGLDGIAGGVFLSDASSLGYAWVRASSGFSPSEPGSVELSSDGTTIYSGMSGDGIYAASTIINYTGTPTAFFKAPSEECINTAVNFNDYSAGMVNSWDWDFGDSSYSYEKNPSHSYSSTGTKNVNLQVSNGYFTDGYSKSIEIKPELEVDIRVAKTGTQTVLLNENFEGGTYPPSGWRITNGGSGGKNLTWTNQNPADPSCSTRTVSSPLSSLVSLIDSDCDGSGATQDDRLYTAYVYPTSCDTLILEFDHYFRYFSGYGDDHGYVDIYTPTLGSYTTIRDYSGQNYGPQHITIDLTSYIDTSLRVRFRYVGAYDMYWMVDNVKITCNPAGVNITWSDISNETGYSLYVSNSPSSGTFYSSYPENTNSIYLGENYQYFRIQATNPSYICGDGPVGGVWVP